ncbi:MAG: rhodanese-like domain-containing protein [Polyangiaceae bacterium]
MFFRKFKTEGLAHVAYLLADGAEAVIVDPRRDVEEYLEVARANGLSIKYVLETHRQEDFVMGSRRLKELLDVKIVSGDHPLFGHSDVRLHDGETFELGSLVLRSLHTPGHTPESTCYAVYVRAAPNTALGVFTGDTLFVGETGRTDLTDPNETAEHAGLLYDAVHRQLAPLGDQCIIWPAHGSGSVCGGNIENRDETTLGIERQHNPVFKLSREEFISAKVKERIPRPPYFRHMEQINFEGGMGAELRPEALRAMTPGELAAEEHRLLVIDTRSPEAFAAGHLPGSLNLWLEGLVVFAGWIAREESNIALVVERPEDVGAALTHLGRVGLDGIEGVLAGGFDAWRDAGFPIAFSGTIGPRELQGQVDSTTVLDVREDAEFEEEGHIPGAVHLYLGYLSEHASRIERELKQKPNLVVCCSVGHRAGLAVSLLQRLGYPEAKNLLGGMTAWNALKYPITRLVEKTITTPDIEGERS